MREVVTLQIGRCGIQTGTQFWQTLCQEHSIDTLGEFSGDDLQAQHLSEFFAESQSGRYVPRCILADTEGSVLDAMRSSEWGSLFLPDNVVQGKNPTGNSWARGRYGESLKLRDSILDLLRKNLEVCDSPQGIQVCHSAGGGTGGGLVASLADELKSSHRDRAKLMYTVLPSADSSEIAVEPYNAVLSVQALENIPSVLFDNSALTRICAGPLKLTSPSFCDLNHIIAQVMSGVTSSVRFSGQQNYSLRKLLANLLPSMSLNFLGASLAPLTSRVSQQYKALTVQELVQQMFNVGSGTLVEPMVNSEVHRWLSCATIFRGNLSTYEIEESLRQAASRLHWSPMIMNTKASYIPPIAPFMVDQPPVGLTMSGVTLGNNVAVAAAMKRIWDEFDRLWKRKAYVWWYTCDGVEEADFNDASGNVRTVCDQYEGYLADPNQDVEANMDE